jgi:hypothetical protein
LALMVVAGGILYLNTTPRLQRIDELRKIHPDFKITVEHYGWPYEMATINQYSGPIEFSFESNNYVTRTFVEGSQLRFETKSKPGVGGGSVMRGWDPEPLLINTPRWDNDSAIWNALACSGSLMFLVFVLEFAIRRRFAAKTTS